MAYYRDLTISDNITNIDENKLDYPTTVTVSVKDENDTSLWGCVKSPPTGVYPVSTDYCKNLYMKNSSYDISLYNSGLSTNSVTKVNTISYKTKLTNNNYNGCMIYVDIINPIDLGGNISAFTINLYDENDEFLETLVLDGGAISSGSYKEIRFILDNISHITIETVITYSIGGSVQWKNQVVNGLNVGYITAGETISVGSVSMTNNTNTDMLVALYGVNNNRYISARCVCKSQPTGTVSFSANITFTADYISYNSTYGYYTFYMDITHGNQSQAISFKNRHISSGAPWFTNSWGMNENDLLYYLTSAGFPNTSALDEYVGSVLTYSNTVNISGTFPGKTNTVAGGTNGTFDDSTDTNTIPALPESDEYIEDVGGYSCGNYNIYKLTPEQYKQVRTALFNTTIADNLVRFFTKPLDGIISTGRLPYVPPDAGNTQIIKIGSIPLYSDDNADAESGNLGYAYGTPINRFNSYDFGTIQILPYWDTALDYNPYTSVKIHLPYIGIRELDTDIVMGKTIGLVYHIDVITGTCMAYITVNGDFYAQYNGNMLTVAPLSGEDFSTMWGNLIVSGALMGVTMSAYSGNPIMTAGAGIGVANSALHSKRDFGVNGSFGGSTSLMENNQPYVEIIRPIQSRPRNYEKYKGYVSTVTSILGDIEGYAEILDCDLSGITATEEERDEIMELLKGGIYV